MKAAALTLVVALSLSASAFAQQEARNERDAEIVRLREGGMKIGELADMYKVSRDTVERALKKAGCKVSGYDILGDGD